MPHRNSTPSDTGSPLPGLLDRLAQSATNRSTRSTLPQPFRRSMVRTHGTLWHRRAVVRAIRAVFGLPRLDDLFDRRPASWRDELLGNTDLAKRVSDLTGGAGQAEGDAALFEVGVQVVKHVDPGQVERG